MEDVRRARLRRSALLCLAATCAATVTLAAAWRAHFQLDTFYLARTIAVCLGGSFLVLYGLDRDHPFAALGAANSVTLARAALIALLAGLVSEPMRDAPQIAAATFVAALALSLDGVDGRLARRFGTESAFGARFDMETDALLILVLSILAWQLHKAGAWVLLSGLLRYLFVLAGWLLPVLHRALPESRRRKAVAALQALALVYAIAPFVPAHQSATVAALALALLATSFMADVLWLLRA
jgi:phosphatidylglycerophosphate synthase